MMSRLLPLWIGASVALHVAVASLLFRGRAPAPSQEPPTGERVIAGETFELPDTSRAPDLGAEDEPPAAPPAPGATVRPQRRASRPARATRAESGGTSDSRPLLFGAVGDRSALDLATSFTRSFPIAASGDGQWAHAPFGSAGSVDISFDVDDRGVLTSARLGDGGSPALRAGVGRTLALIRGRAFTAHGASTRLHVRAVISPDEKHDGLHGDVFALGAGFQGRDGTAFFALSIGRRVDVHVTERR